MSNLGRVLVGVLPVAMGACSGSSFDLPLVTPPVRAAAPAALQVQSRVQNVVGGTAFKNRFFSGAGPTDVFSILQQIDDRITDYNSRTSDCVTATPVAYSIMPFGASVEMFAQCQETLEGLGFIQVGVNDGKTYLLEVFDVGTRAVIVTPTSGDDYDVEMWASIGLNNADTCATPSFDGCSYGAIHLRANSGTRSFEMTVAGIAFGFCGAQLRSDGTNVYATGSEDLGMTCEPVSSSCVLASDIVTPGTCTSVMSFTHAALGRKAGMGTNAFAASLYPAAPNVTLDGTATDDLHFGPTAPTSGVATF